MLLARIGMEHVFLTLILVSGVCFIAVLIAVSSTITSDGWKKNFKGRNRRVAEAEADFEVIQLRTQTAKKQIELDELMEKRIERVSK